MQTKGAPTWFQNRVGLRQAELCLVLLLLTRVLFKLALSLLHHRVNYWRTEAGSHLEQGAYKIKYFWPISPILQIHEYFIKFSYFTSFWCSWRQFDFLNVNFSIHLTIIKKESAPFRTLKNTYIVDSGKMTSDLTSEVANKELVLPRALCCKINYAF